MIQWVEVFYELSCECELWVNFVSCELILQVEKCKLVLWVATHNSQFQLATLNSQIIQTSIQSPLYLYESCAENSSLKDFVWSMGINTKIIVTVKYYFSVYLHVPYIDKLNSERFSSVPIPGFLCNICTLRVFDVNFFPWYIWKVFHLGSNHLLQITRNYCFRNFLHIKKAIRDMEGKCESLNSC